MDSSQNSYNEDLSQLTNKLDEIEKSIFMVGQRGLNEYMCWESRKIEKLTISAMVYNHRKRKRDQMDI